MAFSAHAYVCRGDQASIPGVLAFLERRNGSDIDLFVRMYVSMGIDEARDIRDRAALRGLGGSRIFVIVASALTTEAQNALLKTFEEPPAGAIFVLVVPSPETLLPTLRSRMQSIYIDARTDDPSPIDTKAFLAASPAQRIEMLKPLTSAEEKDTTGTLAFLASLERRISARHDSSPRSADAVYRARELILDKGALRKSLLEQVALLA